MIWELRHEFAIKLLLEVSGLARSTYYYYIKHRNDEDKYSEIKEQITNIFCENKERYGYRRTTMELHNRGSLFTAINEMAVKYDMPILYSCHPRSRKRLESSGFQLDKRVIAHEPLGFHDYNCLQMNAYAVVSDSGTLPEESSFYLSIGHPIPAVCIRTSTERPEALDKGCFILSGIDTVGLLQSVDLAVEMVRNGDLGIPVPDYVDTNVSDKVIRIIQSYVGVVNKMVWRKF